MNKFEFSESLDKVDESVYSQTKKSRRNSNGYILGHLYTDDHKNDCFVFICEETCRVYYGNRQVISEINTLTYENFVNITEAMLYRKLDKDQDDHESLKDAFSSMATARKLYQMGKRWGVDLEPEPQPAPDIPQEVIENMASYGMF